MSTQDQTKVANGLFGPGIFATGIDLSALDEDTALRLGQWVGQQLRNASDDIGWLATKRREAECEAKRLRKGVELIADALELARVIPADWPTEVLEERARLARRLRALAANQAGSEVSA